MTPIVPSWFKQRQCKLEPAGSEDTFKVSGPNLGEALLSVAPGQRGGWVPSLRLPNDPAAVVTAGREAATRQEAWDWAFELFRTHFIV